MPDQISLALELERRGLKSSRVYFYVVAALFNAPLATDIYLTIRMGGNDLLTQL
jgi:hypothetical protein